MGPMATAQQLAVVEGLVADARPKAPSCAWAASVRG
jgi:hypothetical protein